MQLQYNHELQKHPILHADMRDCLDRGDAEIVYDSSSALLLREKNCHIYTVSGTDPEELDRVLDLLTPDADGWMEIVLRSNAAREILSGKGFASSEWCWQVAYDKPVPVDTTRATEKHKDWKDVRIIHPREEDFPFFRDTYGMSDVEEKKRAFRSETFYGIYREESIMGYIGLHSDGSIGFLYVDPHYRGYGLAEELEGFMINFQRQRGRIPYAHVIESNDASLALQKKLGMRCSEGKILWMWKGPEQT